MPVIVARTLPRPKFVFATPVTGALKLTFHETEVASSGSSHERDRRHRDLGDRERHATSAELPAYTGSATSVGGVGPPGPKMAWTV